MLFRSARPRKEIATASSAGISRSMTLESVGAGRSFNLEPLGITKAIFQFGFEVDCSLAAITGAVIAMLFEVSFPFEM